MCRDGEAQFEPRHVGVKGEIGVERFPDRAVVVGIQAHILYLTVINDLAGAVGIDDGVVVGGAEVGAVDGQAREHDGESPGLDGVLDTLLQRHAAVGVVAVARQLVDDGVGKVLQRWL